MSWSRRLLVNGVVWRRLNRFGVLNLPVWAEPFVIANWALIFLLWGPGRRGVMRNLTAIKPGSWAIANFLRTYRVFWNYAWTMTDNIRFRETRVLPDWEFEAIENFKALEAHQGGAILLTAHMGNYDLGAQLFAEISKRRIVMVRAPEADPETRAYEQQLLERSTAGSLRVDFSTRASDLAIDLLGSLRDGELIAIQGDRVTPGIAAVETTLFGRETRLPSGPFALAMAARVPIFPIFVMRVARRRYRLVVGEPFDVVRTRDRAASLAAAATTWAGHLERVIAAAWYQWFTFEPYSDELAS